MNSSDIRFLRVGRLGVSFLVSAVLLISLLQGGHLYAQTPKAWPNVTNVATDCNGVRMATLTRSSTGRTYIRMAVWNSGVSTTNSFVVERQNGSKWEDVASVGDNAQQLQNYLNSYALHYDNSGVSEWQLLVGNLGGSQPPATTPPSLPTGPGATRYTLDVTTWLNPGTQYRIRNKQAVFHLGVAYGTTPPTNFTFNSDQSIIPAGGKLTVKYLDATGTWTAIPLVGTMPTLTICSRGKLKISASDNPNEDFFNYSWTPASNVEGPNGTGNNVGTVTLKDLMNGKLFSVVRKGTCGVKLAADFQVNVVPPLEPILDKGSSDERICGSKAYPITVRKVVGATKIEWAVKEDGHPSYQDQVGSLDPVTPPPTTTNPDVLLPTNINFNYVSHKTPPATADGGAVEHELRVVVSNAQCFVEKTLKVKVYPGVVKPDVVSTPAAPLPGATAGCSPLEISYKDNRENQQPKGAKYLWTFGGSNSFPVVTSNITTPTVTAINTTATQQAYHSRLIVSDKTGTCKDSVHSYDIAANPPTPFKLHDYNPVDVKPQLTPVFNIESVPDGFCTPKKLTLTDVTANANSRLWRYIVPAYNVPGSNPPQTLPQEPTQTWNPNQTPTQHVENNFQVSTRRERYIEMEVNNLYNCVAKKTVRIIAYPPPKSDPLVITPDPLTLCWPYKFTASLDHLDNVASVEWRVDTKGKRGKATPQVGVTEIKNNVTKWEQEFTFENEEDSPETWDLVVTLISKVEGCKVELKAQIALSERIDVVLENDDPIGCPTDIAGHRKVLIRDKSYIPAALTSVWTLDGVPFTPTPTATAGLYEVQLQNTSTTTDAVLRVKKEVTSATGCAQSNELVFTVYPRVDPDFTITYPDPTGGATPLTLADGSLVCPDIDATLRATGAGLTRYEWLITHSGTTQQFPGEGNPYRYTFTNETDADLKYKVSLKGVNAKKCEQVITKEYNIRPGIKADFTVETVDHCTPYRVKFIDQTKTKVAYRKDWTLDGGVEDPPASGIYVYNAPGQKTISLKSTTQTGAGLECISESAPYKFDVLQPVSASISAVIPSSKVCAPATLTFKNSSTNASRNEWVFEPQVSAILQTGADIKYVYKNTDATPRNITVVLKAYNERNCVAEATTDVVIYPEPRPENSYEITDKCHPFKLKFHSKSPSLEKYKWTFTPTGTGASGGATVVKDGTQADPVEVVLTNTSQNDFIRYAITYEGRKDWGGGVVCSTASLPIDEVLVPPLLTAAIDVKTRPDGLNYEICSEESPVEFSVQTTGGSQISHHWDFDDGGNVFVSQNEDVVSHLFANKTLENVTSHVKIVSVQNETLCKVEKTIDLLVHPEVVAQFSKVDGDICQTPRPATFTNTSRGNIGGTAVGCTRVFDWNYGYPSGTETRNDVGEHTWLFPNSAPNTNATMNITLDAKEMYASGKVCKSKNLATGSIMVAPRLNPSFIADKTIACIPFTVLFTNSSTGAPKLRYIWNYADGSTSSESNVSHTHDYNNLSLTAKTDYKVSLTIENEETRCTATATQVIEACPKVTADFSIDNTVFCTPGTLTVHNHSRNGQTYSWNLLGAVGATIPPSTDLSDVTIPLLNSTGSDKQVTLQLIATAQYASGVSCDDMKERDITLRPEIIPDFDFADLIGCSPMRVKITNKSRGAVRFRWYVDDIENPLLQQQRDPEFTLTNYSVDGKARVYKIRMLALNGDCQADITKEVTVYPEIKSKIILSKYNGCTPLTLEAEAGEQKETYSYQWSAVQGTVALPTLAKSEATFTNAAVSPSIILPGTISLKVYFTDAPQCFHESSQQVDIYPGVYPDFVAPQPGCAPYDARFQINTSVFSSDATEYTWSVDGNQVLKVKELSPQDPTIRLINNDNVQEAKREVKLHVRSVHGCEAEVVHPVTVYPKPKALFQVNGKSEGCPPFDVEFLNLSKGVNLKFSYDYGDGSSVSVSHSSPVQKQYSHQEDHEVAYNVTLKAESDKGCVDQQTSVVTVYPQARADFDIAPADRGCSPLTVKFENRSNAPVSKVFYWDFGDGTVPHEMHEPEHIFENLTTSDVTYTTTLVARTDHGCEAKKQKTVQVYATPKVRMALTPLLQVFPNASINLTNYTSPAPSNWDYLWTFGDGQSSTSRDPGSHEYTQWGLKSNDFAYDVNLRVKSPKCEASTTVKAYILPPYPDPTFSAFAYEGCVPFRLALLRDKKLMTPDETYLWDFGDGETSTEKVPIHDYRKVGTYHVKLTVTGDGGVNYAFAVVTVLPNPVVKFTLYPEQVMLPKATIKGQNQTQGDNLTFLWNFGDGNFSTERSPQHDYDTPGKFLVTCVATNTQLQDCKAQDTVSVIVRPEGSIVFPNVFQPSDNGSNGGIYDENDRLNEVFHPYGEGVADYTLRVYDRWGELIFESNDIKRGWDGYWNGRLCETGVYTWRALGHFFNGEVYDLRGNVTLLRK